MLAPPRRWFLLIASPLLIYIFYRFLAPSSTPVAATTSAWTHSEPGQGSSFGGTQQRLETDASTESKASEGWNEERCGHITRDMSDVLVIVKTSATEASEKLPVQLGTVLQCVPHYAVFSDYEETIGGIRTYDVLRNVTDATIEKQPEFQFYKRLQKAGRQGLTDAADWAEDPTVPPGKANTPAAKLDKWKYLPMIDGALEVMPEAKWYVFIEADTYMVWPNLANWLAHRDHTTSQYLGSPMQIGDMIYAHSGGGIILSQKTIHELHELRTRSVEKLEELTANDWAGDCALARALESLHTPLTWSWPMMMISRPWEVDHFSEGYGRQPWCYPVVSYHNLSTRDIEEMWRFDRGWFRSGQNALLLHADVYRELIHDTSVATRADWDNLSGSGIVFDPPTVPSLAACADACAQNTECLQYTYTDSDQSCKQASSAFAGVAKNGTHSGWITPRVQRLLKSFQSSCHQVEYIVD